MQTSRLDDGRATYSGTFGHLRELFRKPYHNRGLQALSLTCTKFHMIASEFIFENFSSSLMEADPRFTEVFFRERILTNEHKQLFNIFSLNACDFTSNERALSLWGDFPNITQLRLHADALSTLFPRYLQEEEAVRRASAATEPAEQDEQYILENFKLFARKVTRMSFIAENLFIQPATAVSMKYM